MCMYLGMHIYDKDIVLYTAIEEVGGIPFYVLEPVLSK